MESYRANISAVAPPYNYLNSTSAHFAAAAAAAHSSAKVDTGLKGFTQHRDPCKPGHFAPSLGSGHGNYEGDGETLEPAASDRLSQLSSGCSDEEPSKGSSGRQRASLPKGGSTTSQLSKPQSLDNSSSDDRWNVPEWQERDESKALIDIDPEEGKKRGCELLSMLSGPGKALAAPLPGAPTTNRAAERSPTAKTISLEGFTLPSSTFPQGNEFNYQDYYRGQETNYLDGSVRSPQGGNQGWLDDWSMVPHYLRQAAACGLDYQSLHAELTSFLYEAAHCAFGPGCTASIQLLADGTGFEVFVQGYAAAEIQNGREEALLDSLSSTLWPKLGVEYVGMDKRMERSDVYPPQVRYRLSLWRSADSQEADSQRCWDYVKQGLCSRGECCRWQHSIPPTYSLDIKVSPLMPNPRAFGNMPL